MKLNFEIELLQEAEEFLEKIEDKAREKILYNIKKSQILNNKELFKKLTEIVWEFRTLYNGKAYRLFAFWDKTTPTKTLVIATHGILKKTQKTPKKEIEKTTQIRNEYHNYKLQKNGK